MRERGAKEREPERTGAASSAVRSWEVARKSFALLAPAERRRWLLLVPLTLVAAGLEAIGAVLIFSLIRLLGNPDQPPRSLASFSERWLPGIDRGELIVVYSLSLAVFYLLKNAFLLLEVYAAHRCADQSAASLSSRMLHGYLMAPYELHFRRNSAELIRNTFAAADLVFRGVMASAVQVVCQALMLVAVVTVLVATAPGGTVAVAAIVSLVVVVLLRLTRRRFTQLGKTVHALSRELLAVAQEGLGGVKEVKILGKEAFFSRRFAAARRKLARVYWHRSTLQEAPRLSIEALFVLGVVGAILTIELGGRSDNLVPFLGLFAYAGFRVLPMLHHLVGHLNSIRFGAASVDELFREVDLLREIASPHEDAPGVSEIPFTERICFEEVSFRYAPEAPPALDGVSFCVAKGESVGIVGETGSGKSTLVDLLLGLLAPERGRMTVDGLDIRANARAWQAKIGYVPQSIFLFDDSLRRNIALGEDEPDEDRLMRAVELAQLSGLVATLPSGLDTRVGERGIRLSGGERQRVAIARALYRDPEILVFDEATSALDSGTEKELTRAIEGLHSQKTVILVAHRLTTVASCDRLIFLDRGRVAEIGSYDDLLARSSRFRAIAAAGVSAQKPSG